MEIRTQNHTSDMRSQDPPTNTKGASSSSPRTTESEALSSWINKVTKKVNDVGPECHPLGPCTIFKIPRHIRRCDRDAYTPVVVPIGPFHHRLSQRTTMQDMQEHKRRCVRYLLSRHAGKDPRALLNKCLLVLKELDEDVRSCYSRKFSALDAEAMAEIMLLDGCFIIHLLLKHACKEREEKKQEIERKKEEEMVLEKKKREEVASRVGVGKKEEEVAIEVQEGTTLREERASGAGSEERVSRALGITVEKMEGLEEFQTELKIDEHNGEIEGPWVEGLFTVKVVLFDLLKLENQIPFFIIQTLFDLLKTSRDDNINLPRRVLDLFSNIHPDVSKSFETNIRTHPIHHLLHLFHSSRIFQRPPPEQGKKDRTERGWIPSATELKRAGVKFRKKKGETCFLEITFDNGRMEIPVLRVSDHTRSLFRNLIAFEQCYVDAKCYFTIYAVFMDCIVDDHEDARLLHLRGIVVNRLSTNENLADLFNKLCNQIYYRAEGNYLLELFADVNKYYHSSTHKWRAGLKRDYFSNPWAIISVVAAILLLLLTIEQAVFTGLSYFHR